jgi:peroxiredoxin
MVTEDCFMKATWSLALILIASLVLASPSQKAKRVGTEVADFKLRDYRGAERSLHEFTQHKLTVLAFLGTDCPLSRLYGARLADMAREYQPKGVDFVGINANQQDSISAINQHAREYHIEFPILKDVKNVIADQLGAQRTPEVFVLDPQRVIRYHGRIDDQYGVGYTRKKIEHADLVNALNELLAGKLVTTAETEPAGCFIGRVQPPSKKGEVTYSRQVARIIQKHCIECHHPGEIGPFSLTSYDEVVGWADTIEEVVRAGRMPPWHADPQFGKFANDCRLSDDDKQLIYRWVRDGAPEGDPKDLPKPIKYTDGWRIPKPDVVISMPRPFKVPATGDVVYQFFAVDPGFNEDKWVKASEVRPGNRAVVHHVLVFAQPPEGDLKRKRGFASDWLTGTVPGAWPQIAPDGMAKLIPAGSRLLFQVHYTPNGKETTDQTSVGLVFADPRTVKREIHTDMAANPKFEIPPHDPDYVVESEEELEQDTLVLSLIPHTHLRGKAFQFEAIYPNGDREVLLNVPRYDFNWQQTYFLAEPKRLPKGSRIHCTAHYDNSAKNLANPDPNATVRWGDQTWEEMMIGYYDAAPVDTGLLPVTRKPVATPPVDLDPALRALAGKALRSEAAFKAFAAAVKKAEPKVDRVCLTEFVGDRLKVVRAAYPGDVTPHFAESGFEQADKRFALAFYALRGSLVVQPDLKDLKKARGADLYVMSKALSSSMHVPVIWDDRPATVNFWSKEKSAFSGETVERLQALGKLVVAGP